MIREFWVENFLSIKERQTLNFETKSKDDEWASVDLGGERRINKIAVIYGANAAGKSNILKALLNVFELLFNPWENKNELVRTRKAFALCADKPTQMHVSFYANHVRYDYTVSYTREHIVDELMEWFPNGSKSLFYERKFVSEDSQASIKFGQSLGMSAKTKDIFLQNTLNNHTVLSCFGKRSFEADARPIANLYNWISRYIHRLNNPRFNLEESLKQVLEDSDAKQFYIQMLEKADFNIVDLHTETETKSVSVFSSNDFSKDFLLSRNADLTKVYFDCKAGNNSFSLSLDEQSQGTKKFLSNLSTLYSAISSHHVYFIDEIDSELHDDLLLYFLNVFLMNSKESQLIFTSQETSLLDEDLLNTHRDFVFFAEKNREGAYSEYTRADEYGLHKNLSLYKSYRNGRLGAVPQLGSPLLYLENDEED